MKFKALALTMFASLAMCGTAYGACNMPDDPEIPDGSSASGAEMLKAKKAVEAYVDAAQDYMGCGVASSLQDRMASKMERVVDKFNSQLRAYKAKN